MILTILNLVIDHIDVIAGIWIMAYVTCHALIYTLLSFRGVSHVQMGCLGTVSERIGVICDKVFEGLVEGLAKVFEGLANALTGLRQIIEAFANVFEGFAKAFEGFAKAFEGFAKAFRGTAAQNSPPVINDTICPPLYTVSPSPPSNVMRRV